jgi:hypothetical protein
MPPARRFIAQETSYLEALLLGHQISRILITSLWNSGRYIFLVIMMIIFPLHSDHVIVERHLNLKRNESFPNRFWARCDCSLMWCSLLKLWNFKSSAFIQYMWIFQTVFCHILNIIKWYFVLNILLHFATGLVNMFSNVWKCLLVGHSSILIIMGRHL